MSSFPPVYIIGGVPLGECTTLAVANKAVQASASTPLSPLRVVIQFEPAPRPDAFHRDCVLFLVPSGTSFPSNAADRRGAAVRYFHFHAKGIVVEPPTHANPAGVTLTLHEAAAKATSELAEAAKLAQELEHVAYAVKQKQMTRADQIVELATGTRMVDARRAIDTIACPQAAQAAVALAFPKGTYVAENAASADLYIHYHSLATMPDPKAVATRTERGDCIFLVQCANAASVDQLLAKYQYNMAVQGVWSVESDAMRGAILACLARLNVRRHRPIQRPTGDTLDTLLTSAATRAAHLGIEHFNQPLQP